MDDELTPAQKFAAEDPETMVPRALREGQSREEIVAQLVRLDWTPEAAASLIAEIENDIRIFHESPEARNELIHDARRQLIAGIIMLVLGFGSSALFVIGAMIGFLPIIAVTVGLISAGAIKIAHAMSRLRLYSSESSQAALDDAGEE